MKPASSTRSSRDEVDPSAASPTGVAGVAAVDRALALLSAYRDGDAALTLTELAARTGLYKSTTLRLLGSLQTAGYMRRLESGAYALGTEVARLHQVFEKSFALDELVLPALRALVKATHESAAFHVRHGDARLCLYRVDSPQPIRDHIRAGDVLPLNRGAGGRVLSAFSGSTGKGNEAIRRLKVLTVSDDRVEGVAGVSAPVFDYRGALLGALTLTMPTSRLTALLAKRYEELVLDSARSLTRAAGGAVELLATDE
jgi:DNA-binding IclR family transcriptional regulator